MYGTRRRYIKTRHAWVCVCVYVGGGTTTTTNIVITIAVGKRARWTQCRRRGMFVGTDVELFRIRKGKSGKEEEGWSEISDIPRAESTEYDGCGGTTGAQWRWVPGPCPISISKNQFCIKHKTARVHAHKRTHKHTHARAGDTRYTRRVSA